MRALLAQAEWLAVLSGRGAEVAVSSCILHILHTQLLSKASSAFMQHCKFYPTLCSSHLSPNRVFEACICESTRAQQQQQQQWYHTTRSLSMKHEPRFYYTSYIRGTLLLMKCIFHSIPMAILGSNQRNRYYYCCTRVVTEGKRTRATRRYISSFQSKAPAEGCSWRHETRRDKESDQLGSATSFCFCSWSLGRILYFTSSYSYVRMPSGLVFRFSIHKMQNVHIPGTSYLFF